MILGISMSEPRKHHFIPQGYLKNFSISDKGKQVVLLDANRKICVPVSVKDVAQRRDFNRIEIDGVDPNIIEKSLSHFEGKASCALRLIKEGSVFDSDVKDYILNLMALLIVRSPQMRSNQSNFYAKSAMMIMDLVLTDESRWNEHMNKFPENERISYAKAKKFFESEKYSITTNVETLIHNEFKMLDSVLRCLYARDWRMITCVEDSQIFLTSDNPVTISWDCPEKIPLIYRSSPGYGMKNTAVYFPLTSRHYLVGRFDSESGYVDATDEMVAICNTQTVTNAYEQIYAPSGNAYFKTESEMKFTVDKIFG